MFCFFNKEKKFFFLVLQDYFCKGNPLSLSWFADVRKFLPAHSAQFLLATVSKNLYVRWHFSSQHFWECLPYIASDYVSTLWITSFSWTQFPMPITQRLLPCIIPILIENGDISINTHQAVIFFAKIEV